MKKGDLLFFRGTNNARTEGVGHVEMYIGDGKILTMAQVPAVPSRICRRIANKDKHKVAHQN